MAIHLTPTELGREAGMHRRDVIAKCMELGVPIFQGRIDKTLFMCSLKEAAAEAGSWRAPDTAARPSPPRIVVAASGCAAKYAEPSEGELIDGSSDGGCRRPSAAGTGSKTIADLLPLAVEKYGDAPAQRFKVGDDWRDCSYAELGEVVREVALGLIDLGIEPGDKISILAHTRPEWTHACFGILTAGATLVTIYQTNSPEECQYVLQPLRLARGLRRGRRAAGQDPRGRGRLPELRHVIVLDPGDADLGDAITLDALRERGRGRDASEWRQRYEAVSPEDICLYIYTSGTTGPPKGCLLSHANYRAITDAVVEDERDRGRRQHLPVPAARARVRDPDPVRHVRARRGDRLLVARPEADHRRHRAGQPELLPVGAAHVREDLHARHGERRGQGRAAQGRGGGREGAPAARRRRARAGRAAAGLRRRRGAAVQERSRAVRQEHPRVRDRRRADRVRDPRVLLRLRRAGDGGLRDDRDLHERDRATGRTPASSASARWASRRPAWR